MVDIHFGECNLPSDDFTAAHLPSVPWRASNRAPKPSRPNFRRSRPTIRCGAPRRSWSTCQRIAQSPLSSHWMTASVGGDLAFVRPLSGVVNWVMEVLPSHSNVLSHASKSANSWAERRSS